LLKNSIFNSFLPSGNLSPQNAPFYSELAVNGADLPGYGSNK